MTLISKYIPAPKRVMFNNKVASILWQCKICKCLGGKLEHWEYKVTYDYCGKCGAREEDYRKALH